jgi:hypothetical protein
MNQSIKFSKVSKLYTRYQAQELFPCTNQIFTGVAYGLCNSFVFHDFQRPTFEGFLVLSLSSCFFSLCEKYASGLRVNGEESFKLLFSVARWRFSSESETGKKGSKNQH